MKIKVYTDGSCRGNGGINARGGWGFVIFDEDGNFLKEGSGASFNTTNNKMEMTAVIEAINWIEENLEKDTNFYEIYTDSAYIHNCMTQRWYINWRNNNWKNSKKEPVKNKELWEQIIPYFTKTNFTFRKVKGHAGIPENEYVDKLATTAADNLLK